MMKRKIIAALLVAVLCIASALPAVADDRTADTWYFGGSGQDTVYDATPLPNGNLLLEGYTQLGRNGREMVTGKPHQTRAWLVCLAPDGSILWEVTDETEGTTRYVSPVITTAGDIAVLFWNSPGQVNTELAIHLYGMDGVLKKKIPLPVDIGLTEGIMTDGFVFYDYEKGYTAVDTEGNIRKLEIQKSDAVITSNTASMKPYGDGWVASGRTRDEDAAQVVARFDANGKPVWRYTTPELAQGWFSDPQIMSDGTILVHWQMRDAETHTVTESRMLCLDENGTLLWEKQLPKDVYGGFVATDEGWIFFRDWMEKTYAFVRFTLVGEDGTVKEVRQAEKRREMLYGQEMFFWNGEAWLHADAEREQNRINDRQTDLELQDCSLIRVKDCSIVTE
ncbi:MAG: hypothetical protein IKK08_01370 [Clostridia bacterium]|nr:hypothetical protein [Clostridia bacterium]